MSEQILEIENLTIQYETNSGDLTAVSNASVGVNEGRYLGLVGESGCGKSTLAKALLGGLDENGSIESGKIIYKGEEIQEFSQERLNEEIRWKEISYIPQSSMNSLDPLKRVSAQAVKIAQRHSDKTEEEALERFRELFRVVGLAEERIHDYPHQFSGGMQQRAIIALALFLDPSLIIADEPTTALDVIMQDQILKYLEDLRSEYDISMILITHDISVVFETCDDITIMHSGQVVEKGTTRELYYHPQHPYSILLQEGFPDIRYPNRELGTIEGHPPETLGDADYCTFESRCPLAEPECRQSAPSLTDVETELGEETQHGVACFRREEAIEYRNQLEDAEKVVEEQ